MNLKKINFNLKIKKKKKNIKRKFKILLKNIKIDLNKRQITYKKNINI